MLLGMCVYICVDVEVYLYVVVMWFLAYATFRRAWSSAFMSDYVFLVVSVFIVVYGEVLSCVVDFFIFVE